jgi:hypothetical protein
MNSNRLFNYYLVKEVDGEDLCCLKNLSSSTIVIEVLVDVSEVDLLLFFDTEDYEKVSELPFVSLLFWGLSHF